MFLKPVETGSIADHVTARFGNWIVAGYGNCYFREGDPTHREPLRSMAARAIALRRAWEVARNVSEERRRSEALWPFLWGYDGRCYRQTEAELEKIGPVAGDYIGQQLPRMSYRQKDIFLDNFGAYHSPSLHSALIHELRLQEEAWKALLSRRGKSAAFDETCSADHILDSGRPEDAEARKAADINGVLYYGFVGLGSFGDQGDLPFIRESALWAVKYRFKQVYDAALDAFERMPNKANLPVIEAIWYEFSTRPFVGNELMPYEVMEALDRHRFPETIPLMVPFLNAGFGQDLARRFLTVLLRSYGWVIW